MDSPFKIGKIKDKFLKFIRKFKKYLCTNILFLTYVCVSMIIAILLRYFTIEDISDIKAFLCDGVIVLLLGSFGYLFKAKNQFKYFFSLTVFYTFLCVINHIYYTFYMSFVSVSLLGTLKMLGDVGDSVTTKLELIYFIYLLAPIIMIIVNHILRRKKYYYEVGKYERGKKIFFKILGTGFIALILFFCTLESSEVSRLVKQWNRDYNVQRFGIYLYTFNDLVQSIQPAISPMFGYDKSAKAFRDFYSTQDNTREKNKYTNIFKGKNVIFIHAESIQNFLIDLEVNGITITPNLNKLAHSGMYFTSFYPQISVGTSSDTEFTLSTGLLPSSSGTAFINYYKRTYESIQNKFNDLGYYTFSMHANKKNFWNRDLMYKTLGYQDFYSMDYYDIPSDKNDPDYIGLGLSDKSFFRQITPYLKEFNESDKPFMGTVITLSNHSPFNDTTKYGDIDFSVTYNRDTGKYDENGNVITEEVTVPYLEDTEMGNYLKSAHYADEALGEFFTELDNAGILDDTVIILYGDHESKLGKKNLNLLYNYDVTTGELKDKEDPTYVEFDYYKYELIKNTPLIIWTKDGSMQSEISDVMGMWDVMPTVANMFGFDYKYALGHDIFSNNEKIVVFPNGNILTNKVYYNNLKEEYILLTNEPIDTTYIDRIKEYANTRLEVSKSIIVHDLIEKEEDNLERVILDEKNKKE